MTLREIDASRLHAALLDDEELALLDLREQGVFGHSHILLATNLPLSKLELRIADLVPRRGTRIVLCDGNEGLVERAAARLRDFGYDNLARLTGGVAAWGAAGYELFSGINVPSKVFGEYVEHHFGTPSISAEELKALSQYSEDLVILDSRPMDEFQAMSIPGGIDTPGAELVYRVKDLAPDPETMVVVNCAGRTRSIIGCQSLINAGVPNRVVALRNGTMGWHLAGFELAHGERRSFGPVSRDGLDWSKAAAARVAERFGVRSISRATLEAWQAESTQRTLYLLDVRDPQDFQAGHIGGSLNAPGGQLVQGTDRWVAVRNGRVVLIDDSGVRARMTASWLVQMGLPDVYVLEESVESFPLETGRGPHAAPAIPSGRATFMTPEEVADRGPDGLVLDLGPSLDHRAGHVPGARWGMRSRLEDSLATLSQAARLIVTSDDGRLATLAAAELADRLPMPVCALEGGTAAWRALGLPLERGMAAPLHPEEDVYHRPYDREEKVEEAMNAYLDWEIALIEQIKRDGTLTFPEFPA